ncbi:hypothetical protein FA13DRAFT_1761289 [Coprinellus micaceus]|uniref:FMR1-interacting protein 1 conserved domain-containing protein n=1 Tax=Coprinellus micaceus TaxID=71717 RepID=A0A4Y7U0C9_COPMI|nr:hypothetical protein FA13DRAFT_1761289 [Coprinellus micaceus]
MNPFYNAQGSQNPPWPFNQQQQQPQIYQNAGYSSHYVQAIMQSQAGHYQQPLAGSYRGVQFQHHPNMPGPSSQPIFRPTLPPTGNWYQPGNKRCTYRGCTFTGSHSSVETHMMDRHLIYPPGLEKRKKKNDWDADPSLKGKPIPIQGTDISLDDPEQLARWIDERKKRFPTKDKVEDKKRKMDEAIARGQLTAEDMGMRPDKRRRTTETDGGSGRGNSHPNGRGRGGGRGGQTGGSRGRGRGRGRGGVAAPPPVLLPAKPETAALPSKPIVIVAVTSGDSDNDTSSSDSDEPPEVVSSKKEVGPSAPETVDKPLAPADVTGPEETASQQKLAERNRPPQQPKQPPRNPFANRPSLLRNLILPEIRVTVSNLSQAIRFLVDNDFLQGVELKPGEASEPPIQVLNSAEHGETSKGEETTE